MSILTAKNLSQSVGSVDVFEGISVAIDHEDKIGLIGPNGVGKTTLLRVLAGLEKPTMGETILARGKRIGYVQQEAMTAFEGRTHSVHQEMLEAFSYVRGLEARMREIETLLGAVSSEDSSRLLDEYGVLQEGFEHADGYSYEERIIPMLRGLDLEAHAETAIHHLSGGQKTRAMLAKALLSKPDLLILDEPTNHLDIEAIEWLEQLLGAWKGALLIVSHDRRFLDVVVNKIWEMSTNRIDVYRGNYSAYGVQREQRFAHELFLWDQEKARLENEMRLVKIELDKVKGGNDTDVSWAKGKLKRITRDVIVLEQLGVGALKGENWLDLSQQIEGSTRPWGYEEADRHLRSLRRPAPPTKMNLRITAPNRGSNIVLAAEQLVVGYPPAAKLFSVEELTLERTHHTALIGSNGSGKTTFIRTMLGELPALEGGITVGPSVSIGYFSQAHDELRADTRLRDELLRHKPTMKEQDLRYHMAQYLFRDDDLDKFVSGLSGGERARLALAVLALRGFNFLVLDEPTNHLDIYALEVLENALATFDGTLLIVSHDRALISKLAIRIWHIKEGKLDAFRGNYDEWRNRDRDRGSAQSVNGRSEAQASVKVDDATKGTKPANRIQKPAAGAKAADKPGKSNDTNEQASKNAHKRTAQLIVEAEQRVAKLEEQVATLTEQLQLTTDFAKIKATSDQIARAQEKLDAALVEWERAIMVRAP